MADEQPTVAVIGGTGALGSGLVKRWALAGLEVIIGSRTPERAKSAAAEMVLPDTAARPRGAGNAEAASAAEIVIVTVPFANQERVLEEITGSVAGKLVVDTTVPLRPPKVMRVQMPAEGAAAVRARNILGDGVRVGAAFHNVAAHKLQADAKVDCDVLVFGEPDDRKLIITLANAAGLRGLHGGPLENAAAAEALTSVLIGINKRYNVNGAGIRITGIITD